MLYMLLICYDPTVQPVASEQNLQPEHHKLEVELRERGVFVSGAGLWPVERAKRIRQAEGRTMVTDGPFAETKEALGGYYIVDCDEAEAVAIAGRIPVESRSWVEVRPIALFHPNVRRISQMTD
jgi:hypothetical protein